MDPRFCRITIVYKAQRDCLGISGRHDAFAYENNFFHVNEGGKLGV